MPMLAKPVIGLACLHLAARSALAVLVTVHEDIQCLGWLAVAWALLQRISYAIS